MIENQKIEIISNECQKSNCEDVLNLLSSYEMKKVLAFHKSFPQYAETPLIKLDNLAARLGVKAIYVKDESYRFGLNAFKVLGGSYAIARYIAKLIGKDVSEMTYKYLTSKELRGQIGQITFFTATDGNHGRGVAWAANKLGQKSVVYMPAGSSQIRLDNIRAEGAEASIIDGNYDDAVRLAAKHSAETPKSVVVQDTAWEGYEEIPGWIMQGYGTMVVEAENQLENYYDACTHVFVQAGVGSLAGAVQGIYTSTYGEKAPKVTIVEPHAANCLYESAKAKDYKIVTGEMRTIMAGLACGEPNTISWKLLKNYSDAFASCPEWVAAKGMRILSSPSATDERVISGESGAVGAGLLAALMQKNEYTKLRDQLGLNEDSVVLLFSTEGDTDPEKYLDIIWDGEYPSL
ncbi:MAG: diaminopropionate ammonia-lyase [Defluviitaleaceae bacterium]|nr:diaminopropionate ammonia-lyase [Defluviitaleaceae bacterium]